MAATDAYRALFERAPLAIWEEDFSEALYYLQERAGASGQTMNDLLDREPDALLAIAERIRIIDANPSAIALFEAPSKSEFITHYHQFFHEETMPAFVDFIRKAASGDKFSDRGIEIAVRTFLGRKRFIELSWSVVEPTASSFRRLWFFAQDIDARVRAQQDLQESEFHLRESQRVGKIGSYLLNIPAGTLTSSPVLDDIFGIDHTWDHSLEGWRQLLHSDDRASVLEYLQNEVLSSGIPFEREYRICRPRDQETRWVSALGELVQDADGNLLHMIGTIRDITETKRAEEELRRHREHLEKLVEERSRELKKTNEQLLQSQKMEAIGTLAGGIAHDFNNLLATISGTAELLLDGMNPEEPRRTKLERVVASCARGKSLTMKLLTFARKEKLQVALTSLNQIAKDTIELLRGGVVTHVRIVSQLDPDLLRIHVDVNQITQALLNVCLNACDAMPEGGTLTFRTYRTTSRPAADRGPDAERETDDCVIEIADTGHGIEERILGNVCEPFFTTKAQGQGTGLGLSVALGIIQSHQGTIELTSTPGRGTVVTVRLPAAPLRQEQALLTIAPEVERASGARILIIDDDREFVEMIREALHLEGHEVIACMRGDEAVDLFRRCHDEVELIILDMLMPEMDGVEVFQLLREISPEARVVLCSGYSVEGRASELLTSGARSYLQKPFEIAELRRILDEALAP